MSNSAFFVGWDYGGALLFDGMYQVIQAFPSISNYSVIMDAYLGLHFFLLVHAPFLLKGLGLGFVFLFLLKRI